LAIKRELNGVNPYDNNVSYAVASAETGNNYINDKAESPWPVMPESLCSKGIHDYGQYSCVPGVLKQVHMYLEDVNQTPNKNTLFILWAGGNDFYQNIVKISGDTEEKLSHPISNIVKAVKLLMASGVPSENIYVFNLPNFSMVPAITTLVDNGLSGSFKRWAALTAISIVSKGYNIWLKTELVLATYGQFSPSNVLLIDDLFLDIYYNKNDLHRKLDINHPVATPCATDKDLPYCHGFLFYNDMHPVTKIHDYLSGIVSKKVGESAQ
jgi:elongation factor P hydroxylase